MKKYIILPVDIKEEDFEAAYFALSDFPFSGIEERFDELRITFDESDYSPELKSEINYALKEMEIEFKFQKEEDIQEKNWNEEWENQLKPFMANDRIALTPSARVDEIDAEIKVIINPKMSFGTGEHATTRLVASLMDGLVKKDTFWVDAGCGTGALAILAVKLGAKGCYAFDNNEWAVENSIENVAMNDCSDTIKVEQADIDLVEIPECDAIAANLFIHLIKSSMPKFYTALEKTKGILIVSGVMTHDAEIAISKAEDAGFELIKHITEDEWSAFYFRAG